MSIDNLKYWLSLAKIESIGPVKFQKILNYFPNLRDFWHSSSGSIIEAGIEPKLANEIIIKRQKIDPDQELDNILSLGIEIITWNDDEYPKLLKEIYAPPPLIYIKGGIEPANDYPLAVVGTRKITSYGQQVTQALTSELAAAGLTIISGLALGIDACAHRAALDIGGKTVAVLGSGLDDVFPAANRRLADEIIASGGAVISEFPPGTLAYKNNFPRRNRIISGLSLATLVTEAGQKSGALITARYALEQNREVFAVPGGIFSPLCAGPNNLIKQGAAAVTAADDILKNLNLDQIENFRQVSAAFPDNHAEKIIYEALTEPLHIDKLVRSAKLDICLANSTLTLMEMKGLVRHLGGQIYARNK